METYLSKAKPVSDRHWATVALVEASLIFFRCATIKLSSTFRVLYFIDECFQGTHVFCRGLCQWCKALFCLTVLEKCHKVFYETPETFTCVWCYPIFWLRFWLPHFGGCKQSRTLFGAYLASCSMANFIWEWPLNEGNVIYHSFIHAARLRSKRLHKDRPYLKTVLSYLETSTTFQYVWIGLFRKWFAYKIGRVGLGGLDVHATLAG